MIFKIVIQLAAVEYYNEGVEWYKQLKVPGLSNAFRDEIKSALIRIKRFTSAFSVRYKDVRVANLSRFPYAIHFIVEDDVVIIIAMIYSGRDPDITHQGV